MVAVMAATEAAMTLVTGGSIGGVLLLVDWYVWRGCVDLLVAHDYMFPKWLGRPEMCAASPPLADVGVSKFWGLSSNALVLISLALGHPLADRKEHI